MEKIIDNPIKDYKENFSKAIKTKTKDYFDKLIKDNDIDRVKNRETVSKYNKTLKKYNKIESIILLFKVFGFIFIAPILILALIMYFRKAVNIWLIFACVGSLFLIVFSFIIAKKFNKQRIFIGRKVAELRELAEKQVEPLIKAIDDYAPIKLFNEVIPNVKLDFGFFRSKHEYMEARQAIPFFPENRCVIGVYSGAIGENPFIVVKFREQKMKSTPYSGSLDIHWETVEKREDENGEEIEVVVEHSQTLHAVTYHDVPVFDTWVETIFDSPIADNLSFSREPFGVKNMSDRKVNRRIKSTYKKYKKQEIKSMKSDKQITLLENEDFEALFGAIDRNDEMQFRLLFTPLAQQNIVNLIRNREFDGDEFSFAKNENLNINISYSFQNLKFNYLGTGNYYSFDIDKLEKDFVDFVSNFSKEMYMNLLPFLSIPAYQQDAPAVSYKDEESLKDDDHLLSTLEMEASASTKYKIGNSGMPCIYKASYSGKRNVSIDMYGFDSSWETEYVTRRGDDGKDYDIPIQWRKFEKVSKKI